jgi:VanZ family protein
MIIKKVKQFNNHPYFFRISLIVAMLVISYLAFSAQENSMLDTGYDKSNHFIAFFVLAFLCHFSFIQKNRVYSIFLPLLIYAVFIESVQYFLPYRTFSLLDIIADIFAVLVYLILAQWLIKN